MIRVDDIGVLIERARALAAPGSRRVLGIAGAPGSGKSTLAARIAAELGDAARLVGMDGFHLAGSELERLGRAARKGAVDTFDAAGYAALLARLRDGGRGGDGTVVYAPEFRREIEEPIAGAVAVPPAAALVITEGNYLLHGEGDWARVRGLLDEAWYLDADEEVRIARLVARHVAYGKPPDVAEAWSRGTDQRNAELVARGRERADVVIRLA
jgi:pantothenate kinase